jgi:hypothetical protein
MYTLEKIRSIVKSCLTYEQAQSCMNIVNLVRREHKFVVLGMVQEKVFQIRNNDLKEHREYMCKLRKERFDMLNNVKTINTP